MIETTYRVEVAVPSQLVEHYGRDTDFVFAFTQATRGHSAAGRGRSAQQGLVEWAEFSDRLAAEICERQLLETVAKFQARLSTGASTSRWQRAGAPAHGVHEESAMG